MTEDEWELDDEPQRLVKLLLGRGEAMVDADDGAFIISDAVRPGKGPSDRRLRLFALACARLHRDDRGWDAWASGEHRDGDFTVEQAALFWVGVKVGQRHPVSLSIQEKRRTAKIIRCVFGNPWHPPKPIPLYPQAVAVAKDIRESERYDELTVLADALEDTGHADARLLVHLRENRHVRGCHALDAVLGLD